MTFFCKHAARLVLLALLLSGCKIQAISHSPQLAAEAATRFARLALVERDYNKAYILLSPDTQKAFTEEAFIKEISKLNPTTYPREVTAKEFEPVPGQKAINIFLVGTSSDETYYYRIILVGDSIAGYTIAGFFRGSGPYPNPEARTPLSK